MKTQVQFQTTTKPKQNWLFNFIKFIFALLIVIHHTLPEAGLGIHSFYVLVEGFLFISGIFLYRSATTKKTNTFKYMLRKYLSLLPAIIFGAVVAFIIEFIGKVAIQPWNWANFGIVFGKFIADLIPIQYICFNNPDFWFLCSLLWASFLLYPLVKKAPKVMPWVCLGIFIAAYTYNIVYFGSAEPWQMLESTSWWFDFWLLLRGIAGLSVGIFVAGISNLAKIKSTKKPAQICHSVFAILLIAAVIVICWYTAHTRFDFLSMLFMMIFCFMALNNMTYFNANYRFDFASYLSGISMFLYVYHHITVRTLTPGLKPFIHSQVLLLLTAFAIVVIVGAGVYIAYYFAKKAIVKHKAEKKAELVVKKSKTDVKVVKEPAKPVRLHTAAIAILIGLPIFMAIVALIISLVVR